MQQHEMIEWFKCAPAGSRHARMTWAAERIAERDHVTVARAYVALDRALAHPEVRAG